MGCRFLLQGIFLTQKLNPGLLHCRQTLYRWSYKGNPSSLLGDSLVSQTVKSLPAMRETWAQSLGCEDPLEKETATHSSILAWKIPWTEEPGGLQSHSRATSLCFSFSYYTREPGPPSCKHEKKDSQRGCPEVPTSRAGSSSLELSTSRLPVKCGLKKPPCLGPFCLVCWSHSE